MGEVPSNAISDGSPVEVPGRELPRRESAGRPCPPVSMPLFKVELARKDPPPANAAGAPGGRGEIACAADSQGPSLDDEECGRLPCRPIRCPGPPVQAPDKPLTGATDPGEPRCGKGRGGSMEAAALPCMYAGPEGASDGLELGALLPPGRSDSILSFVCPASREGEPPWPLKV